MILPNTINELTVSQYIEVTKILKSDLDELDKNIKVLSYLSGTSVDYIESHTPKQIKEWAKEISFIHNPIPNTKPVKWFMVGRRAYKPVLRAEDLTAAQLVSLKHFVKTEAPLNEMLACVFVEMNWYGKAKPYNSEKHEQISKDMLSARIGDVYGTLFFYSDVLEKSNPIIQIYLNKATEMIQEIMPEVLTWAKSQGLLTS